jgi:hypothetical protein
VYRRGRRSSIQGQTVGDNVGKPPWAAGTGNNLQGLLQTRPKAEGGESPTGAAHEPVRANAGVYTNQRLNLSKPWEGTRRTRQGLEPDPGNLAVRDFRGASRNVRHGETVNPPCNRKSRIGNPLQRGALDLYPNGERGERERAGPYPLSRLAISSSRFSQDFCHLFHSS